MNNKIRTFERRLSEKKVFIIIIFFTLLCYVFSFVGVLIAFTFNLEDITWRKETPYDGSFSWGLLFSATVFAPLFETLIFQSLPYKLLYNKWIFKNRTLLFITLISTPFGLVHYFSPIFVIITYFSGVAFMSAYIFCKKYNRHPFIVTTIVHSIINIVAFFATIYW